MKELKVDIKNKSFRRMYLLFGDERYLVEQYGKSLSDAIATDMMSVDVFEGKNCSVDAVIDSAMTVAFLSDYRLVVLRDTGLFAQGRKNDTEKLADFLPELPDTSIMVFTESNVDKRSRLYKRVSELGRAVEFKRPSEKELIDWIIKLFAKNGKQIAPETARLLLRTVAGDMQLLVNEAQKLIAYRQEAVIEPADIETVCTKALETRIFDLVAAVGNKDPQRALDIFNNMVLMKESPIMVLVMIARQLRLILQCKYLAEKSASPAEIAAELGLRGFTINDYLRQSRNFSVDGLITALERVLDADMDIKTGGLNDKLAVEILILETANTQKDKGASV